MVCDAGGKRSIVPTWTYKESTGADVLTLAALPCQNQKPVFQELGGFPVDLHPGIKRSAISGPSQDAAETRAEETTGLRMEQSASGVNAVLRWGVSQMHRSC